jgi:putative SOS response-associated peptidase YedK
MCGRFSFTSTKEKVERALGITLSQELQKNYNIAPTQKAYVVTNEHPQHLQAYNWGLIPHWADEAKMTGKLINARSESISSKPSFRIPIRHKRCLVLADSFYEWKPYGKKKLPYRIMMKNDQLMVMAGIWDVWKQGNEVIKTFSILTTLPNKEMETIHNRMPVIFPERALQKKWLEDISLSEVLGMMQTLKDNSLKFYQVSDKLNSVEANSEELHHEVLAPPTLFD